MSRRQDHRGSDGRYIPGGGTHGSSRTPEYRAWINMRSRCYTEGSSGYQHYGGRGIGVCRRWVDSFSAFLDDMGPRPSKSHSVERRDVNGDYGPGNCFWATQKVQSSNRRNSHIVEIDGEKMALSDAVEKFSDGSLNYNTVLYRLRRGKTIRQALGLEDLNDRRLKRSTQGVPS